MATVTGIARSGKNTTGPMRVELSLDGAAWGTMSETLVTEFRLYSGKELDEHTLEELRERITQTDALIYCHASIAARASTEHELAEKLRARGYDESIIGDTMERCRHLGLVDDERYARQFAEGRIRRGHGRRRIADDLYKRGVDKAVTEAALDDVASAETIATSAIDVARRRFARLDLDDPKQRAKAQRFLLSRGHSYGDVDAAIRALRAEHA